MKNDVLQLIIQAEEDYQKTVHEAVLEAEQYVDEQRDKQSVYIKQLEEEWTLFEGKENRVLEEKMTANQVEQEAILEQRKIELQARQQEKKADISERLKKEVLTFYGNR